jgi:hypothetical protein
VDSIWRRKLCLDAADENLKKPKQMQAKQELGASSKQEMQARPSREKPQTKPLKDQGQRAVLPKKLPELQKAQVLQWTRDALTNINIAIFREAYPEDKLNEEDQIYILKELGRVLRRTPTGELTYLKS